MKTIKITSLMLLSLATLNIKNTYSMNNPANFLENNENLKYHERMFAAAKSGNVNALNDIFTEISKGFQKNKNLNLNKKREFCSKELTKLVNYRYNGNHTLLHVATENKNVNFVEKLLELNADQGVVNFQGNTALDIAKKLEREEVSRKQAREISKTMYDKLSDGEKLFFDIKYSTCKQDEDKNIQALSDEVGKLNFNTRFYNDCTFCHAAVTSNSPLTLKFLVKIGLVDLDARTNKNLSPLEMAIKEQRKGLASDSVNRVEFYSEYRPLINYIYDNTNQKIGDDKRKNRFYGLIKSNNIEAVIRYIKNGKDISFSHKKTTPLHLAIELGFVKIAELLISCNANIRATDEDENTPLHIALKKRLHYIIILLLSKGAPKNACNLRGYLPIDLLTMNLCNKGLEDLKMKDAYQFDASSILIMAYLSAAKPKMSFLEIYQAADKKADKIIKDKREYLKKVKKIPPVVSKRKKYKKETVGGRINQPQIDFSGDPLTDAIQKGNVSSFKTLLGNVDINTPLQGKNSLLHIAIMCEQSEIVKILLNINGLRLSDKNDREETPLKLAKLYSKRKSANDKNQLIFKLVKTENKRRRIAAELKARKRKLKNKKKK